MIDVGDGFGFCKAGHAWGLDRGHLVTRYTIRIRNVEKSAYIVNGLINVKLRHTLSLFGWFTFVEVTSRCA